jgi:PIN domain nuclease of toxin-antitoxin system
MSLLLDTHVFLWWLTNPSELTEEAHREISDSRNRVYVSAAVVWEIAINKSLGKLIAPDNIYSMIFANKFEPLSISILHSHAVLALPALHRDPFDRIMIVQALVEKFTIVTRDPKVIA